MARGRKAGRQAGGSSAVKRIKSGPKGSFSPLSLSSSSGGGGGGGQQSEFYKSNIHGASGSVFRLVRLSSVGVE